LNLNNEQDLKEYSNLYFDWRLVIISSMDD